MVILLGYSLDLVRQGHTTLEEVGRMILTDSGLESERRRCPQHNDLQGLRSRPAGALAGCPCLTPATSTEENPMDLMIRSDGTTGGGRRQRSAPRHRTAALRTLQRRTAADDNEALEEEDCNKLIFSMLNNSQRKTLEQTWELDCAYGPEGGPLPRQRLPAESSYAACLRARQQDPQCRTAQPACGAGDEQASPRDGAGHRSYRLRQNNNARRSAGSHQSHRQRTHSPSKTRSNSFTRR